MHAGLALAALTVFPAFAPASASVLRPGQPAPDVERCWWTWIGPPGAADRPSQGAAVEASAQPRVGEVMQQHGRVVIVQSVTADDAGLGAVLPDLRAVAEANRDRELTVLALCSKEQAEAARGLLERTGMELWLGSVSGERRYFLPGRQGQRAAYVIGRSGELVWMGDPVDDARGFRSGVVEALRRPAGPALRSEMHPSLEDPLSDYWAGRYEKARARAKKLLEVAMKRRTEEGERVIDGASRVVEAVGDLERSLLAEVDVALSAQDVERLVQLDARLSSGFRGESATKARNALKVLGRDVLDRAREAEGWIDLLGSRPLLFPTVRDEESERYAKRLEKALQGWKADTDGRRRASALLGAYAAD